MSTRIVLLALLVMGCDSESGLTDKPDGGNTSAIDTADPDGTTGNGTDGTATEYGYPNTDTWNPTDGTPPWTWGTEETGTPPTGGTPTGGTPTGGTPTGGTPTGGTPTGGTPTGTPPTGGTPTGSPPTGSTTGGSPPTGPTTTGGSPPTGTTTGGGTGVPTTFPTPGDTGITDDEICEAAAALAGYLDAWQIPNDGRVYYCHNSGGSNWVFVESDISSCLPHLNHAFDVFPSSGCDS